MENGGAPELISVTAAGPPEAAVPSDLSGKTLGDFRVQRRIGVGGMGQVYLAEQVSLRRPVALKIMKAELSANPTALKRFQAEAEAVARVTHAHIVQVHAIGQVDGLHFMALEYVEGRNLRDYLSRKGPPELPLALSIMIQVASALQRAHELGIVHRDIKPENILLTKQGEAKVTDFGLSRCFAQDRQPLHLTQSGVSLGTPLYMSPEQVQGREIDPRTDIYSLGVTCYHMLAGEPPFRGANAFDVAVQHVQSEPPPLSRFRPDLPADLCGVIHKMMAKKPEDRYQSSRDLLADLTRVRDQLGPSALAITLLPLGIDSGTRLGPPVRPSLIEPVRGGGHGLLAGVVGSLVLALGIGVGLRAWLGRPGPAVVEPPTNGVSPTPSAIALREQAMIEAVRKPFSPRRYEESKKHLEQTVQLGIIYLEQRRLKDAEAFFKELRDKPPQDQKVYPALGRIGLAVILAFQDQAKESNQLFAELEKAKPPFTEKFRPWDPKSPFRWNAMNDFPEYFLFNVPEVRRVVAEALDCNAANLGVDTLPEPLEKLRKPPVVGGFRPGSN